MYCPTENMIADILTKALPTKSFERLRSLMGLRSLADLKGISQLPANLKEFRF
jgi:hypothetical protein